MSKAKFTKGEWIITEGFMGDTILTTKDRLNKSKSEIVTIEIVFSGEISIEQKANAHLIAAAPEMYELLEELECSALNIEQTANNLAYRKMIRELLAKARGEK